MCYNDKVSSYLKHLVGSFTLCEFADEKLFRASVDKKVRTQKNLLKDEPYEKILMYFKRLVLKGYTPEQYIRTYGSISYADFIEFKSKFLKNIWTEWVILGHLEKDTAVGICEMFKNNIEH